MLSRIGFSPSVVLLSIAFALPAAAQTRGILLLAHGGDASWNGQVEKLVADLDDAMPVEVAFGMANKRTIEAAVGRLIERDVTGIVAVPLFISSHSSIIRATEYLLGARDEAPPELEMFARMDHGGSPDDSVGHDPTFDPTTPVATSVPITVTTSLNSHPLVAEILVARAEAISRNPEDEVIIIVAHGPTSDDENTLWLQEMAALAALMSRGTGFSRIEYLTVRDDAPEPIRDQAAADLRALVELVGAGGKDALIVPLLLSYGGIEDGIRERLEGLSYSMTPKALLPDERLARWVMSVVVAE